MIKFSKDSPCAAYIDSGVELRGTLNAPGEVIINGEFEGVLNAELLTIGETGHASGMIQASTIHVHGRIDLNLISLDCLVIHATGRVTGDVLYQQIEISKGGTLEGSIRKIENE